MQIHTRTGQVGGFSLLAAGLVFSAATACQKSAGASAASKSSPRSVGSADAALTTTSPKEAAVASIEILGPGGAFTTATPTLRWTTLAGASYYQVRIDDSEECTSPLQTWRTAASSQPASYLPSGVYYVCVGAYNSANTLLSSATGSFWVMTTNTADPELQNGQGGSGAALASAALVPSVLFQDDWDSALSNRDGGDVRPDGVAGAYGLAAYSDPADGAKLKFLVNDRGNRRVLLYGEVPSRGQQPILALGQESLRSASTTPVAVADAMSFGDNVHAAVCPGGQLLVTDQARNRVLVWNAVPGSATTPPDLVLGQTNFSGTSAGTSAATLNQPSAATCINDQLFILDRGNHRILVYRQMPTTNGAAADFALGQKDLNSRMTGCNEGTIAGPTEILLVAGQLLVTDSDNNRVLGFTKLPTTSGQAADFVLGQDNLRSCEPNRGAVAPTGATLNQPSSLAAHPGELAVADAGNHRILLYALPLSTGKPATKVLGQPTLTAHYKAETPQAEAIGDPHGLIFDGGFLWSADYAYKRVTVTALP